MGYLASVRTGWEGEHLAEFILSKFAFVARPSTVSDDIGSDFFGTFFEVVLDNNKKYLKPKNSFAIQIKSPLRSFDVSNKIDYLWNLEIPFLVGISDRDNLRLDIYSGEYLPLFFSHKGCPNSLKIQLSERKVLDPEQYCLETGDREYVVKFPKVLEISAKTQDAELASAVDSLSRLCALIYDNIASRRNKEYIFKLYDDPSRVIIFAGEGSIKVFRDSFFKRLAEVFANLHWLHDHQESGFEFEITEFRAYERVFNEIQSLYAGILPGYLTGPFNSLRNALEEKGQFDG
jgi:hypothetical protein